MLILTISYNNYCQEEMTEYDTKRGDKMGVRKRTLYMRKYLENKRIDGEHQISTFIGSEAYEGLKQLKVTFGLTTREWIEYHVKMDVAKYEEELEKNAKR